MRSREVAQSTHSLRSVALGMTCVAALALSACGSEDFENDPRPASPIELTAAIDKNGVTVAPGEFGAGIVTITISNQTDETTTLVLDGPTPASSGDIPARGTGSIKTALEEGDYEASAGAEIGIKPAKLTVGPPRETSQNDLLLP